VTAVHSPELTRLFGVPIIVNPAMPKDCIAMIGSDFAFTKPLFGGATDLLGFIERYGKQEQQMPTNVKGYALKWVSPINEATTYIGAGALDVTKPEHQAVQHTRLLRDAALFPDVGTAVSYLHDMAFWYGFRYSEERGLISPFKQEGLSFDTPHKYGPGSWYQIVKVTETQNPPVFTWIAQVDKEWVQTHNLGDGKAEYDTITSMREDATEYPSVSQALGAAGSVARMYERITSSVSVVKLQKPVTGYLLETVVG